MKRRKDYGCLARKLKSPGLFKKNLKCLKLNREVIAKTI